MKEFFKKGILTGIGIGLMTKDKIKELVNKISEEFKMSEEEARKFTEELLEESKDIKEKINEMIDSQVKKTIEKLGLATREDIEKLEKKIEQLEQKLSKQSN